MNRRLQRTVLSILFASAGFVGCGRPEPGGFDGLAVDGVLARFPDAGTLDAGGEQQDASVEDAGRPDSGLPVAPDFLVLHSDAGFVRWLMRFGRTPGGTNRNVTVANSVAVDSAGNISVGGTYARSVNLGGPDHPNLGHLADENGGMDTDQDAFLASYTSDGTYRYSIAMGGPWSEAVVMAVAHAADDGPIVAGTYVTYAEGPDFGAGPLGLDGGRGTSGPFVGSYSPTGKLRWLRFAKMGGCSQGGRAAPWNLAVDRSGAIVAAGLYGGCGEDFSGKPIIENEQMLTGGFVAKFDADGSTRWAKQYGNAEYKPFIHGMSLSPGDAGDLYFAGQVWEKTDGGFMQRTLPVATSPLGMVTPLAFSIDADGALRWAKALEAEYGGSFDAVSVAENGEVIAVGHVNGRWVDFAGQRHPVPAYDRRGVVAVYGPDGDERWIYFLTATGQGTPSVRVTNVRAFGNVAYVFGHFAPELSLGGVLYSAPWTFYAISFIARFDLSTRQPTWVRLFHAPADRGANSVINGTVAMLPGGDLIVGGMYGEPIQFGDIRAPGREAWDGFVFRMKP